jgi:Protein of unknown function (DUF998)
MVEGNSVGPPTSFASPLAVESPTKRGPRLAGLGKMAAMASILATAYFLAAAAVAHVVMTQYDFFRDYISDYAVGPWGWIYGSAFLASAIGSLALAASLILVVPAHALSRLGVALLVVVGATYAVDFAFPTEILAPGAPPTTVIGVVHLLGAVVGWASFAMGGVMISSKLRRDGDWRAQQPVLTALAWLSVLLIVVLICVVLSKAPFGGLAEKLFILDRNVWALILSVLVFKAAHGAPSRTVAGEKRESRKVAR